MGEGPLLCVSAGGASCGLWGEASVLATVHLACCVRLPVGACMPGLAACSRRVRRPLRTLPPPHCLPAATRATGCGASCETRAWPLQQPSVGQRTTARCRLSQVGGRFQEGCNEKEEMDRRAPVLQVRTATGAEREAGRGAGGGVGRSPAWLASPGGLGACRVLRRSAGAFKW